MKFFEEDYQLLHDMVREDIERQMNWLKTKNDPHFKLFNAGQLKAFQYVLELITFPSEDEMGA